MQKRFISVLLTLLMMAGVIAVAPVMASAAGPGDAGTCDVVSQNGNDATGVSFNDALAIAKLDADDMVEIHLLADIAITGNLTLEDEECINLYLNGKTLAITGGLNAGNAWVTFYGPGACNIGSYTSYAFPLACYDGGTVTANGNVNCTCPFYGIYSAGVFAQSGGIVTVNGNVTVNGAGCYGATAISGGKITVEGTLTVSTGSTYIHVGDTDKTQADYTTPTTKTGYLTYTDGTGTVWVKDPNYVPPDPPKYVGLFGLNTSYPSNFLNWLLFIVCFGWIWMWFI